MTITKCLCAVRLGHTFRLERYLVDLVSFRRYDRTDCRSPYLGLGVTLRRSGVYVIHSAVV